MKVRLAIPETPESSPLSQGPGPLRVAVVILVVLGILVWLRFFVWSQPATLDEGSYDRPIAQRYLHLEARDEEFPEGWRLDEGPRVAEAVAGVQELAPQVSLPAVPEPGRVERVQVSAYRDPADQPAWLVALQYRGAAPEVPEAAVRQDHHLVLALRAGGGTSTTLAAAVKRKAHRLKRVRVWAEKMKTLGSAYVSFGLDVVLGMLLGALLLFLTKYFLITRETDGI